MEDAKEASPKRIAKLDKHSTRDIDTMVLDDPDMEEVGNENGI